MATFIVQEDELYHGVEWKRHKYIRKEGNRYIYPDDLKRGKQNLGAAAREVGRGIKTFVKESTNYNAAARTNKGIADSKKSAKYQQNANHYRLQATKASKKNDYENAAKYSKLANTNQKRANNYKSQSNALLDNSKAKNKSARDFKNAATHAKRGASYIAKYVSNQAKKKTAQIKKDNKLVRTHDGQLMTAKKAAQYDANYRKAQNKKRRTSNSKR